MKLKSACLCVAVAALTTACGNKDKSADTVADSDSQSTQIEVTDTAVADTTTAAVAQEESAEIGKDELQAESPAADNGLDAEVDKIISMIQEHTDVIKGLTEDGIISTSSIAFRALENLPNYDSSLKKIKNKLSPEQKARIDAAQKQLDRAVDKWNKL